MLYSILLSPILLELRHQIVKRIIKLDLYKSIITYHTNRHLNPITVSGLWLKAYLMTANILCPIAE